MHQRNMLEKLRLRVYTDIIEELHKIRQRRRANIILQMRAYDSAELQHIMKLDYGQLTEPFAARTHAFRHFRLQTRPKTSAKNIDKKQTQQNKSNPPLPGAYFRKTVSISLSQNLANSTYPNGDCYVSGLGCTMDSSWIKTNRFREVFFISDEFFDICHRLSDFHD